jgi:tetratricopeptide (TPR) repeat protein
MTNSARSLALQAQELAQADPDRARQLAEAALDQARSMRDHLAVSLAERALGLMAAGLEHLPEAERHLVAAIGYARKAGDQHREGEARMTMALVLVQKGKARRALRELALAETALRSSPEWSRYLNHRAAVHYHLGHLGEALADFDRALAASRQHGDLVSEARLLSNRAVLKVEAGAFRSAERDLLQATEAARRAGQTLMLAGIEQNIGWLHSRIGDIPAALSAYQRAEEEYQQHGETLTTLLLDRSGLELGACLLDEARQSAERARASAAAGGLLIVVAEADLCLAETQLLSGDAASAAELARAAEAQFTAQHRTAWAALAHHTLLQARLRSGDVEPAAARRAALRSARRLAAAGWIERALEARLTAVELAVAMGRLGQADQELRAAAGALRSAPVSVRTHAWHARATIRLAQGDRRGAVAAIRSGVRALEQYRAVLGATDLRAAASEHSVRLTRLGIRLALQRNRAEEAFRWAESGRACALRIRPVRPPQDERFAAELAMLRSVIAEIGERTVAGQPTSGLRRRQAALERAIRDRSRQTPADGLAQPHPPVSVEEVRANLGDQALVEFVDLGGELVAIAAADGAFSWHPLGETATITRNVDMVLFHLRRLLRPSGPATRRSSVGRALADAAGQLEHRLLEPLRPVIGNKPLVIVPAGALQSLPWSVLSSCRGRSIAVSPSATAWYLADRQPQVDGSVLLAAGPGLPGAAAEVAALAALYPAAARLTTPAQILNGLGAASVAHLAAHGRLRADSPMFSSLVLSGGELFVHDLEQLPRTPHRVVLSACDVGRSDVRWGEEVLGLAAAFLALGTSSLIAAVLPIPDQPTLQVMTALHGRLLAGRPPAAALAEVQDEAGGDVGIADGLICLGAAG